MKKQNSESKTFNKRFLYPALIALAAALQLSAFTACSKLGGSLKFGGTGVQSPSQQEQTPSQQEQQKPGGQEEQKPGESEVVVELAAPTNVKVENGKVKWDNGQPCEGYEVSIDGVVRSTTEKSLSFNFEHGEDYEIKVRTLGDGEAVNHSDWAEVSYHHEAEDFKQFQIVKQAMESKLAEVYPDYTNIEFIFANEQNEKTIVFFNAIDENGEAITRGSLANFNVSFDELAENPSIIDEATSWQLYEGGFRNDELTNYVVENMTANDKLETLYSFGWQIDEVLCAEHYFVDSINKESLVSTIYARLERGAESKVVKLSVDATINENLEKEEFLSKILSNKSEPFVFNLEETTSELGQDVSKIISNYGSKELGGSSSAVSEQKGGQTNIGGGIWDMEQGI